VVIGSTAPGTFSGRSVTDLACKDLVIGHGAAGELFFDAFSSFMADGLIVGLSAPGRRALDFRTSLVTGNATFGAPGTFLPPLQYLTLDIGGDLTFEAGSVIDATLLGPINNDLVPGDRFGIMVYGGALPGVPDFIHPAGFEGFLDLSTPGVVTIEISAVPGAFEWVIPAVGNVFAGFNWLGGVAPIGTGNAFVHNGGTAFANGDAPGAPAAWFINSLTIGDQNGAGAFGLTNLPAVIGVLFDSRLNFATPRETLSMSSFPGIHGDAYSFDTPSFATGDSVEIGSVDVMELAHASASGYLLLENIPNVDIGRELDICSPNAFAAIDDDFPGPEDTEVTSQAFVEVRDIGTLGIEFGIGVRDGDAEGCASNDMTFAGSVRTTRISQNLFENIDHMIFPDGGLDIADGDAGRASELTSFAEVTFRHINLVEMENDFDVTTNSVRATARTVPGGITSPRRTSTSNGATSSSVVRSNSLVTPGTIPPRR